MKWTLSTCRRELSAVAAARNARQDAAGAAHRRRKTGRGYERPSPMSTATVSSSSLSTRVGSTCGVAEVDVTSADASQSMRAGLDDDPPTVAGRVRTARVPGGGSRLPPEDQR